MKYERGLNLFSETFLIVFRIFAVFQTIFSINLIFLSGQFCSADVPFPAIFMMYVVLFFATMVVLSGDSPKCSYVSQNAMMDLALAMSCSTSQCGTWLMSLPAWEREDCRLPAWME